MQGTRLTTPVGRSPLATAPLHVQLTPAQRRALAAALPGAPDVRPSKRMKPVPLSARGSRPGEGEPVGVTRGGPERRRLAPLPLPVHSSVRPPA